MKTTHLMIAFMLAVPAFAQAGTRSVEEMKAAAREVIPVHGAARSGAGSLEVLKSTGQMTVIGYANGGYAIIANDDKFAPVLGYSDQPFGDNIAPAMQWWMDAMELSLEKQLAGGAATRTVAIPDDYAASVAPLTKTTWGQNAPYWNNTPVYTAETGETHYVTGCVATAMSQIMKYHEYPVTGTGESSYEFNGQTLSANYGETTYDWANMLDSYTGGYNDAQAEAVATLMSHCGISVNMQYKPDGSGAYSADASRALKTHFGYSENIRIYNRDFYGEKEWMAIVYRELNDACPILYSGSMPTGFAHSFVLDGYDEAGLVHVNWGWEGENNGYFDIVQLNGFTESQEMVVVREPGDTRYTDVIHSCWGTRGDIVMSLSGFNIVVTQNRPSLLQSAAFVNTVDKNFTGEIALLAENLETHELTDLRLGASVDLDMSFTDIPYNEGFVLPSNVQLFASIASLFDGQYRIYFASKDVTEDEWYPVRSNEEFDNNYILTIDGRSITLELGDSQWTAGVDGVTVDNPDDGVVRVYTVDGVEIYSAPAAGFSVSDVPAKGLLIVKKGDNVTKVMRK